MVRFLAKSMERAISGAMRRIRNRASNAK
jgi:hypothetical protein